MRRLQRDDGGDGVLEDELFLIVGFEHEGILIEALDAAGKLDPTHQIDGEDNFVFSRIVQKTVLNVLRRLIHNTPWLDSGGVRSIRFGDNIFGYNIVHPIRSPVSPGAHSPRSFARWGGW